MAGIQSLVDLFVSRVEKIHDYIQVVFSDGTLLNIFNNHQYNGGSIADIEYKQVKAVDTSDAAVIIVFDNGGSLSVSLKDEDYNGPEAMVMIREDGMVVWN